MIKAWIKVSRQLSLGSMFFLLTFFWDHVHIFLFYFIFCKKILGGKMQHRWSEDLDAFLYQLLKFRAAACSAMHHLAFVFLKESSRVGLWPIKVEEQTVGFSLCVCARACMPAYVYSSSALVLSQFFPQNKVNFWILGVTRFLWCDLTCQIVVPLWQHVF